MAMFPIRAGQVASLYQRVLRRADLCPGPAPSGRRDFITISAAAKRQKIFEETRSAVLTRIRNGT